MIRYQQTLAKKIWFLPTGDKYTNLQFEFQVHTSTVSKFIPEVSDTIYKKFKLISYVFNSSDI